MNDRASVVADPKPPLGYSYRRAHETNAFDQFPLITPAKLRDEARHRDIERASSLLEELERLDREGAFRSVAGDPQDLVSTLSAEILHVGGEGLADAQPVVGEQGNQGQVPAALPGASSRALAGRLQQPAELLTVKPSGLRVVANAGSTHAGDRRALGLPDLHTTPTRLEQFLKTLSQ